MSKEITSSKRARQILAGRYMLGEGLSLKKALIKAGYSENTARTPGQHGLSAKVCIELALQEDRETTPATLVESSRELLKRRLEVALENPRRESLTAVSRTIEAVERSYRGAQDPSGSSPGPRTYADRLVFIAGLVCVQIQPGEGPAAAVARLHEGRRAGAQRSLAARARGVLRQRRPGRAPLPGRAVRADRGLLVRAAARHGGQRPHHRRGARDDRCQSASSG